MVVYRASGRINLAQGELATFGTYLSLVLSSPPSAAIAGTVLASRWLPSAPWPLWVSIPAAMVISAIAAALLERLVVRRIPERNPRSAVSVTIGLLLLVNALTKRIWRPVQRGYKSPFPNFPDDYFLLHGARLRYTTIGTWLTMLALFGGLWLVLRFTKGGLAFRAVSSNRANSQLMGIRTGRVLTTGWALAAAIGTLAGCLLASRLVLSPDMMAKLLIYGFASATIGGLTSMGGSLLGGLIVGVVSSMLSGYVHFVGNSLSLPVVLLAMVIMLLVRPAGLFGTKGLDGTRAATTDALGVVVSDVGAARYEIMRGSPTWRKLVTLRRVSLLVLAILPAFIFPFLEARLWTELLATMVTLWGLGLLMGPAGQLSLGHGAFVGLGAYTTAVIVSRYGWSPVLGVLAAAILGFTVGCGVGLPALRIKGQYLAMMTLSWAIALPLIIQRFAWFTGGSSGPKPGLDIVAPSWFPVPHGRDGAWLHLLFVGAAAVVLFMLANILRGAPGRAIRAAAEEETAAAAMGVPIVATRTITFGLAAALGAMGGGMLAVQTRVVTTEQFDVFRSLTLYAAIAFGGAQSLAGAGIGAALLVGVPWFNIQMGWKLSPNLFFGVLVLIGAVLFPDGIAAGVRTLVRRIVQIVEAPHGEADESASVATSREQEVEWVPTT